MRRVIIAGGRDFDDFERLHEVCNRLLDADVTVISGNARGADTLGEQYAEAHEPFGMQLEKYPADWDKHKKAAGHIRNHQMSLIADGLIAFWDDKSKGTKNMIEQAHKAQLETHVYYYKGNEDV